MRINLFATRVSYRVLESDIGNNAALQLQQKRVCVFRAHGTCLLAANIASPVAGLRAASRREKEKKEGRWKELKGRNGLQNTTSENKFLLRPRKHSCWCERAHRLTDRLIDSDR